MWAKGILELYPLLEVTAPLQRLRDVEQPAQLTDEHKNGALPAVVRIVAITHLW